MFEGVVLENQEKHKYICNNTEFYLGLHDGMYFISKQDLKRILNLSNGYYVTSKDDKEYTFRGGVPLRRRQKYITLDTALKCAERRAEGVYFIQWYNAFKEELDMKLKKEGHICS